MAKTSLQKSVQVASFQSKFAKIQNIYSSLSVDIVEIQIYSNLYFNLSNLLNIFIDLCVLQTYMRQDISMEIKYVIAFYIFESKWRPCYGWGLTSRPQTAASPITAYNE